MGQLNSSFARIRRSAYVHFEKTQKTKIEYTDLHNLQTQGAIVGANQQWPEAFNLNSTLTNGPDNGSSKLYSPSKNLWIFSATNAIVYFAASTVGAFLCDPLTHVLVGRRGAIFVAALFTFTASIGEAFVGHSWHALFACRL